MIDLDELEKMPASEIIRRRAALFTEIESIKSTYLSVFNEEVKERRRDLETLHTYWLAKIGRTA